MTSYTQRSLGILQNFWRKANRCKKLEDDILGTKLQRCLRTWELVFMGLCHMLGPAVYVTTGVMMSKVAGASTLLSYVIGGVVSILNGICYAQFSVNIPKAGSAYNYVYVISGELLGFMAGWNLILESLIALASVARGMSAYIDSLSGHVISNGTAELVGHVDSPTFGEIDFLAGGLCITTFVIVSIGVKAVANFNIATTGLNIIVLLVIAIGGYAVGSIEKVSSSPGGFFPYGASGTLTAAGMSIYAYIGYDAIAVAAEETANPNKSLPRAMVICIVSAGVLYLSVTLSLIMLVPYDQIDIQIPFPAAFDRYGLYWLAKMVTFGSLFGMISSLLGTTYCLTRSTYAMACDGLIFRQLSNVNSITKTPLAATVTAAIISTILSTVTKFEELAEMNSIGALFAMSAMLISLLKLHYIPADECPFEVFASERDSSLQSTETEEKMPILPKSKGYKQKKHIGALRYLNGIAGGFNTNDLNTMVLVALTLSLFVLSIVIMRTMEYIIVAQWWAILFLALAALTTAISLGFLLLFEPNRSFVKYSVPFIPWLPVITLFSNMCLMIVLRRNTWIRLIIWTAIGLLVYVCYGINHSTAHKQEQREIELMNYQESTSNSSAPSPKEVPKDVPKEE